MADDVAITAGSGTTIATDEISSRHYQRVKLVYGADGSNEGDTAVGTPYPISVPLAGSVTIMSVTTAATGTNWTAFSSQACNALDLVNTSAVSIDYRRGGAGSAMTLLSGTSRLIVGISNANSIEVKRTDSSNTTVTIPAEAITV